MENFLAQLKQRQIFQVATIYVVSAWPIIQIADLTVPALGLPDSVMTLLLQVFIAGFIFSLVFSWLFNFTKKGIVRATEDDVPTKDTPGHLSMAAMIAGGMFLTVSGVIGSHFLMGFGHTSSTDQATIAAVSANTPVNAKESIAVLPFVPFSKDQEDEFFADGMVEELLNLLARIPDLQVAARTSSFAYKGVTNKTIQQIGQELGVDTLLEGSIRKNDITNQIRVTAQLIKVSTGEHLWSETYDREYLDIFQIQDDIASAVVDKMKVTLLGTEQRYAFVAQTNSVDAMVAFGKGQRELSHRTASSLTKALGFFTEAIALDSNYARAYVGLADANFLLALYSNLAMPVATANAHEAIAKALAIDENLGEAYATLGLISGKEDPKKAEEAFKKALQLSPNYAMAYMWYGSLLKESEDPSKALALFEKAFELDPKSPVAAFNIAWQYHSRGDEEKAMEMFSYIIANDPYYPAAYNLVGSILSERGRLDQSIDMFKRTLQVDNLNKDAITGLLMANLDLGDFKAASQWFEFMDSQPDLFNPDKINLFKAQFHYVKGEDSQAFEYLDKIGLDVHQELADWVVIEKLYYRKDYPALVTLIERIRQASNNSFYFKAEVNAAVRLAFAYQQLGESDKADGVLAEYQQYLDKNKAKKGNKATFNYNMALLNLLQNKQEDGLYYLQAAINAGWVKTWQVRGDPVFKLFDDQNQLSQMVGGVDARLATMRSRMASEQAFMVADNDQ